MHPIVEIVLPLAERGFVSEDFLCRQATVLGDRDEAEMHMRCFFVHMNDRRDHIFLADPLVQECGSPFKELPLLFAVQFFHDFRGSGNQCFDHDHTVLPCFCADSLDALCAALFVLVGRFDQMIVLRGL